LVSNAIVAKNQVDTRRRQVRLGRLHVGDANVFPGFFRQSRFGIRGIPKADILSSAELRQKRSKFRVSPRPGVGENLYSAISAPVRDDHPGSKVSCGKEIAGIVWAKNPLPSIGQISNYKLGKIFALCEYEIFSPSSLREASVVPALRGVASLFAGIGSAGAGCDDG
jgi:hypothetical protein